MIFSSSLLVTKISSSNLNRSKEFYERVLGFKLDPKYSITHPTGTDLPYLQMNLTGPNGSKIVFGLYQDIPSPFSPKPTNGTVPSFLVDDIESTLAFFQENQVSIDKAGDSYILTNKSDEGYIDQFFFFRDPDNNSLVIRQNIN
ncbi:VOC family protein [Algoriphagus halophilus]|uniref:Catechol 2,3-dioxygenase n=1 Tax=Algoriphagus halophilus TaxID=226505 RepID=A0A1N6H8U1_9BACT|nr:VOC family protein [Algoriphagus halophilus]SIO16176.1 Catechol 2,3-dioxygenase [Algoriphagus halophilus]